MWNVAWLFRASGAAGAATTSGSVSIWHTSGCWGCGCCLASLEIVCLLSVICNKGWFLLLTSVKIYEAFVSMLVWEYAVVGKIFDLLGAIVRRLAASSIGWNKGFFLSKAGGKSLLSKFAIVSELSDLFLAVSISGRLATSGIGVNKGWSLLLTSFKVLLHVLVRVCLGLQRVNGILHGVNLLVAVVLSISQGLLALGNLRWELGLSCWGNFLILVKLVCQASDARVAVTQLVRQIIHFAVLVVALQCSNLGPKRALVVLEVRIFTGELFVLTSHVYLITRALLEFKFQVASLTFACSKHWHRISKVYLTFAKFRGKGSDLLIESWSIFVALLAFSQFL